MNSTLLRWIASGLIGVVFGAGLTISGMVKPAKVIGFLDVTGNWDPSLGFVMGGAIAVFAPLYAAIAKRTGDDPNFMHPVAGRVDTPLIMGAAMFGVGWGMAGYCPGPGITCVASGDSHGLVFFVALFVGMLVFRFYQHVATRLGSPADVQLEADVEAQGS